jgi:hypothetical protein
MDAAVRFSDGGLALATAGQVLVSLLRLPLTLEGVTLMRRESRRLSEQGPFASMSVIEPTAATAAPAEVREASAAFAREFHLVGAAIAIEGSGFRPAATRTLIAGLFLVTKKSYPHRIVQTPREAAEWLVPLLAQAGIPQSADELVSIVSSARRALATPSGRIRVK